VSGVGVAVFVTLGRRHPLSETFIPKAKSF